MNRKTHKFVFIPTILLTAGLAVLACTPKRPANVPEAAIYNPKGGYAWNLCEQNEHLETLPLYVCTHYSEDDGTLVDEAYYITVDHITGLDEFPYQGLEKLPLTYSVFDRWGYNKWWEGKHLYLVYKANNWRDNDGNLGWRQLYIADKQCLALMQSDRFPKLETYLKQDNSKTPFEQVPKRFEEKLNQFTEGLSRPDRSEKESGCLMHFAWD